MKKLIFSLLIISVCICNAQVNTSDVTFNKTTHDFGVFPELEGTVTYSFTITNTGKKPLIIYDAKPSCSCTVSKWNKSPILSGASTTIETSYNPQGRPGMFSKSIKFYTNVKSEPYTLVITGKVKPRPLTIQEQYPISLDHIRLSTNKIKLNEINSQKSHERKVSIINTSNQKVKIEFPNKNKHISASCSPNIVEANEIGIITINYDAQEKQDWGWCYDNIPYTVNGGSNSKYSIKISANILDKSTEWTEEELKNAPIVSIDNKTHLFDEAKANDKVECPFLITNTGKRDLIIHKIKHACSCTSADKTSFIIQPDQSITLPITFDTKNTFGKQRKTITLYTNAIESTTKLTIQGSVLKDED